MRRRYPKPPDEAYAGFERKSPVFHSRKKFKRNHYHPLFKGTLKFGYSGQNTISKPTTISHSSSLPVGANHAFPVTLVEADPSPWHAEDDNELVARDSLEGMSSDRVESRTDKKDWSSDKEEWISDQEWQSSDKEGLSSDKEGRSFDKERQISDKEGWSSDKEGRSSKREERSFVKVGSSSDRDGRSSIKEGSSSQRGERKCTPKEEEEL